MNPRATGASVREGLGRLLDDTAIVPEAELPRYAVEGLVPKAVVFPTSEEQVSRVLALAAREGWAVAPRGAGSLVALGGVPERMDVAIGLSRLHGVIDHAPGDLTVTVGAGTTLVELQQRLAQAGQWLPLDPPLAQRQTVGGVLATILAGPLSFAFGTARDMVIGMRVAGPDGVITKSGGKVVKNVTGFDVPKLHLGALGTLGMIVEASLKVVPKPGRDVTLAARFESLDSALMASRELVGAAGATQALEVMAPAGHGVGQGSIVYARFMGGISSMERRLREGSSALRGGGAAGVEVLDGDAAAQTWRRLADFGWDAPGDEGLLLRLGCLPSRVLEMATGMLEVAKQRDHPVAAIIGPNRGVTRCYLPDMASKKGGDVLAMVAEARQLAARLGGYAVVERCPLEVKRHLDVWGDSGDGMAIMRRLKEQMDPGRILNPGRFVGGI